MKLFFPLVQHIQVVLVLSACCASLSVSAAFCGIQKTEVRQKSTYYTSQHGGSSRIQQQRLASSLPDDNDQTLQEVLQVAVEASKKAGEIILKHADGADVVETKATRRDLLTLVDPVCEKAIRETVQASYPDHDFLGEEQVEAGIESAIAALEEKLTNPKSKWLWIVDPIDGTTNFASGIPINMPSIAVAYEGEPVIGVLYDPHNKELFSAIRGHGAFLNGEPIQVGEEETLGDATVGMESPAGQESLEQCVKAIQPLMPAVRTIRMLGSSAVMLPWVANGRLTAYWTPDECAWDIAAGALIVQEAGGKVTDLEGKDYTLRTRSLVSSNGRVHDALLEILQRELLTPK